MAERRTKLNLPGIGLVDGIEVGVLESTERWTDIKLQDGTTLRVKPVIMSVVRVDGRYDQQGNPMYAVQTGQAMTADAPDHLRKQETEPKVQ
jgi:hypothetical protein